MRPPSRGEFNLFRAAMLNVALLGGASISSNGGVIRSDLGTAGRLLAYYLFEFAGRSHPRERLPDLFWPDMDADRARSALNTALWRIRKILDLGPQGTARSLVTIGDNVILELSDSLQVDTYQLQCASRRVLARAECGALADGDIPDASVALERYARPFLDGEDHDRVLQERERLHCLFVRRTRPL